MIRVFLFLLASLAYAAPCVTATAGCTEWITFNSGPSRSMIYRSHPLTVQNANITRALIVIHGQGRNADDYFLTGAAAAFLAGALDDTLVISPRFTANNGSCKDDLAAHEVNWQCAGNSWRSGAFAVNNEKLSSYDFTDELLSRLANKSVFPNLHDIVVSGHSAGGQYVSRYAMASPVYATLGVRVSYVVSNPSSYAYLDASRPGPTASCEDFDQWPYGLQRRTGAAEKLTPAKLKENIATRPVVLLLGQLDTLPIGGFDSSCGAMAQGPNRLARGQAYAKYLTENFGAKPAVTVVPYCGHNARCIYTANPALPVLFPKQ